MADELEQKAAGLFEQLVDLPTEQREAAMLERCGSNAELLKRVRALLSALGNADQFLKQPTMNTMDWVPPSPGASGKSESLGTVVGPYKLLQEIGQGGFGVVYMAEQSIPVRRRVALKVIKLGMDTKEVIARFDAERQALAMMDHPNIARVLDAGMTGTGRPYFVMELVSGVPITTYCDSNQLSARKRLELMVPVCRAVQSAHQKGIIHRDLKPSNVMVTMHDDHPVPKVIDFGIAKATSSPLTEHTLFTAFHQFVGTPTYMSPEQTQMSGQDVDTRADVYGLGVLLYELLTGTTPIDPAAIKTAAFDEMARYIRETHPVKPSSRIGTMNGTRSAIASKRGTDYKKLSQTIRGELDWIVMKALEKDRTRRYDTASALADDLSRYLDGRPVAAGPPSEWYRLRKIAQRHKKILFTASIVLLALLAGVAGITVGLVKVAREKQKTESALRQTEHEREVANQARVAAQISQQDSELVLNFITQDVFGIGVSKAVAPEFRDQLASLLSGEASTSATRLFHDKPPIEAAIRQSLAETLLAIDRPELALKQAEISLQIRRDEVPASDPAIASSSDTMARVLAAQKNWQQAEPLARFAWEHRDKRDASEELAVLNSGYNYGTILDALGKSVLAIPILKEVVDGYRLQSGMLDYQTIQSGYFFGQVLAKVGRSDEAIAVMVRTFWAARRELGYGSEPMMGAMKLCADLFIARHNDVGASFYCAWWLEWQDRLAAGKFTPAQISALDMDASVQWRLKHYKKALPLFERLEGELKSTRPANDPAIAIAEARRKECFDLQDQPAAQPSDSRLAAAMSVPDDNTEERLLELEAAADQAGQWHQLPDAENQYRKIISLRKKQTPIDSTSLVHDLTGLAKVLAFEKHPDEAIACMRESLQLMENYAGPKSRETCITAGTLADELDANNRRSEAADIRKQFGVPDPFIPESPN